MAVHQYAARCSSSSKCLQDQSSILPQTALTSVDETGRGKACRATMRTWWDEELLASFQSETESRLRVSWKAESWSSSISSLLSVLRSSCFPISGLPSGSILAEQFPHLRRHVHLNRAISHESRHDDLAIPQRLKRPLEVGPHRDTRPGRRYFRRRKNRDQRASDMPRSPSRRAGRSRSSAATRHRSGLRGSPPVPFGSSPPR